MARPVTTSRLIFFDLEEAIVAQSFLQSNGIFATMPDRRYSMIDPLMRIGMGGIRISVPEGAEDDAARLIHGVDRRPGVEFDDTSCPRCGRNRFTRVKPLVLPMLLLLLYGSVVWWRTRRLRCVACKTEFKPDRRKLDVPE
ncbi:MAG: hypothetical protein GC152_05355 [Alphaproteobacteria bacterium]|nr:hypothetical protein [Alphaproteobacteria bacterium]